MNRDELDDSSFSFNVSGESMDEEEEARFFEGFNDLFASREQITLTGSDSREEASILDRSASVESINVTAEIPDNSTFGVFQQPALADRSVSETILLDSQDSLIAETNQSLEMSNWNQTSTLDVLPPPKDSMARLLSAFAGRSDRSFVDVPQVSRFQPLASSTPNSSMIGARRTLPHPALPDCLSPIKKSKNLDGLSRAPKDQSQSEAVETPIFTLNRHINVHEAQAEAQKMLNGLGIKVDKKSVKVLSTYKYPRKFEPCRYSSSFKLPKVASERLEKLVGMDEQRSFKAHQHSRISTTISQHRDLYAAINYEIKAEGYRLVHDDVCEEHRSTVRITNKGISWIDKSTKTRKYKNSEDILAMSEARSAAKEHFNQGAKRQISKME